MPVLEGLLPEEHDKVILDLSFDIALLAGQIITKNDDKCVKMLLPWY